MLDKKTKQNKEVLNKREISVLLIMTTTELFQGLKQRQLPFAQVEGNRSGNVIKINVLLFLQTKMHKRETETTWSKSVVL